MWTPASCMARKTCKLWNYFCLVASARQFLKALKAKVLGQLQVKPLTFAPAGSYSHSEAIRCLRRLSKPKNNWSRVMKPD
jgi:hypothetical protein